MRRPFNKLVKPGACQSVILFLHFLTPLTVLFAACPSTRSLIIENDRKGSFLNLQQYPASCMHA